MIHQLLKGHIARRIVYLLEQQTSVTREQLLIDVYNNHPDPDQCLFHALRRIRAKLQPLGWTINTPKGGYGHRAVYRLEKVTHD